MCFTMGTDESILIPNLITSSNSLFLPQVSDSNNLSSFEKALACFFKCTSLQFDLKCLFVTNNFKTFNEHLRTIHEDGKFYCIYCFHPFEDGKIFMKRKKFLTHLVVHHKFRRYQCNRCSYRAVTPEHVENHLLNSTVHPDVDNAESKIIVCQPITAKTMLSFRINLHHPLIQRRLSNFTTEFNCIYCSFSHNSKESLFTHLSSTHLDSWFYIFQTEETRINELQPLGEESNSVINSLEDLEKFIESTQKPIRKTHNQGGTLEEFYPISDDELNNDDLLWYNSPIKMNNNILIARYTHCSPSKATDDHNYAKPANRKPPGYKPGPKSSKTKKYKRPKKSLPSNTLNNGISAQKVTKSKSKKEKEDLPIPRFTSHMDPKDYQFCLFCDYFLPNIKGQRLKMSNHMYRHLSGHENEFYQPQDLKKWINEFLKEQQKKFQKPDKNDEDLGYKCQICLKLAKNQFKVRDHFAFYKLDLHVWDHSCWKPTFCKICNVKIHNCDEILIRHLISNHYAVIPQSRRPKNYYVNDSIRNLIWGLKRNETDEKKEQDLEEIKQKYLKALHPDENTNGNSGSGEQRENENNLSILVNSKPISDNDSANNSTKDPSTCLVCHENTINSDEEINVNTIANGDDKNTNLEHDNTKTSTKNCTCVMCDRNLPSNVKTIDQSEEKINEKVEVNSKMECDVEIPNDNGGNVNESQQLPQQNNEILVDTNQENYVDVSPSKVEVSPTALEEDYYNYGYFNHIPCEPIDNYINEILNCAKKANEEKLLHKIGKIKMLEFQDVTVSIPKLNISVQEINSKAKNFFEKDTDIYEIPIELTESEVEEWNSYCPFSEHNESHFDTSEDESETETDQSETMEVSTSSPKENLSANDENNSIFLNQTPSTSSAHINLSNHFSITRSFLSPNSKRYNFICGTCQEKFATRRETNIHHVYCHKGCKKQVFEMK